MSIQVLREKRQELYDAMKAHYDAHQNDWTEQNQAKFRDMAEDVKAIDTQIANFEEMLDLEAQLVDKNIDKDRLQGNVWNGFGDFLKAVAMAGPNRANADPRLLKGAIPFNAAGDGSTVGTPSEGGFLVPTEMSTELMKNVYDNNQVISRCTKRPLMGPLEIPAIDETSRADGSRFGGIQMYWKGEEAALTSSKPAFSLIKLDPHKLTGLYFASDEVLEDVPFMAAEVTDMFTMEADFKIQEAIINGTGAGQPLGVNNSTAMISTTRTTSSDIEADDIINMWARAWGRGRANGVWLISQDIEPSLFKMTIAVGTGGIPVYMPANGLSGSPFGSLMGRPVIPIEQCQTLGTAGDIIFGDFSQYILAQRSGLQSAVSIHLKFDYAQTAFRWIIRLDGQPRWKSPLTPYNGGNTQSPFVRVAT